MDFKLYSYSTGEPVDMVEMHVLAKAYRAAWRVLYAREPGQCHLLAALDLVIDFDGVDAAAPAREAPRLGGRGSAAGEQ